MKRYILFYGETHYPKGGMHDLIWEGDVIEDGYLFLAEHHLDKQKGFDIDTHKNSILENWEALGVWAHLYDSQLKTILWSSKECGRLFPLLIQGIEFERGDGKIIALMNSIMDSSLMLLSEDQKSDLYVLQKLYDWQEGGYDDIPWSDFLEKYYKCNTCKGYDTQQCICYAR